MPKINRYWNSDPDSLVEYKRPETYDLCKSCECINQLVWKEKRLKRALWLARANSARNKVRFFGWAFDCYDTKTLLNIDGHKYKMPKQNRLLICEYWIEIFENVERLCKAKAEEYK